MIVTEQVTSAPTRDMYIAVYIQCSRNTNADIRDMIFANDLTIFCRLDLPIHVAQTRYCGSINRFFRKEIRQREKEKRKEWNEAR